mmetsp:Transcript_364/g.791  ORF Transcript_364/g.791 Transcript_364/m.791 type:complete len:399 (-) Transcript_364:97-1293(-)
MKTTSFLGAASAKIIADKICDDQSNSPPDRRHRGTIEEAHNHAHAGALRLLLVEEEKNTDSADITNDCSSVGIGSCSSAPLALSLIMDAAYSLVSGSLIPCRGCCEDADMIETNDNDDAIGNFPTTRREQACHCCKVVILVPGEVIKPKKKRRRRNNNNNGSTTKCPGIAFPMPCLRHHTTTKDGKKWEDPTLLRHIQIKYVNSMTDVKRYLAYAPSLPETMQPLEGIFLLDLGELMSRQGNSHGMEFTQIISFLSDTANVLEDKRMEQLVSNSDARSLDHDGIAIIATIDGLTYSSIPPRVIRYHHHWIDFIASIVPARTSDGSSFAAADDVDANTSHSEWNLVFKNTGILEPLSNKNATGKRTERETSFGFEVNLRMNETREHHEEGSTHNIAWRV